MNTIEDFICAHKVNTHNISLSKNLYSVEALRAATYEISYRYNILLIEEPVDQIKVILECKSSDVEEEEQIQDIKDLLTAIIDHQLRQDLVKKFGFIRDKIVEKAFEPITVR